MPAPTLHTPRLTLRELATADAARVAARAGDRRVARHLIQVPSPYPVALAARWVEGRVAWWHAGRGVTLAITKRDDPAGALIGTVSLRRYPRDRRAELGYWLGAVDWGNGLVTEACASMIELGFTELGLARIYAQVLAENRASCRVLDKLGMVNEGVKRQHVRHGRRLHDVVMYGLLRAEWKR